MKDENEILRRRCEKLARRAEALDELVVFVIEILAKTPYVELVKNLTWRLENIRYNTELDE